MTEMATSVIRKACVPSAPKKSNQNTCFEQKRKALKTGKKEIIAELDLN